ncbi:hypothetical protein Tco_1295823, partial [Tanacetum coccineum]
VSGPDLEPMQEDQTGSDSGKLHVSLAGPNPEHMDDEFLATAYPNVTPPKSGSSRMVTMGCYFKVQQSRYRKRP